MKETEPAEYLSPMLTALDSLVDALEIAMAQDDEEASGLIIWAMRDLADIIDLADKSGNISKKSRTQIDDATRFSLI